jgi:hypothetical protein
MSEFSAPPTAPPVSSQINMSTLSEAYELLRRRLKPMAIMGAIYFAVMMIFMVGMMAIWFGTFLAVMASAKDNPFALMGALYFNPIFWALIFVANLLPIFAQAAFSGMTFQDLRGEEPTIAEGFDTLKRNFSSLLLLGLIVAGIQLVVSFCGILSLFFQAAIFIAVPAMLEQKLKPVDALKYSWAQVQSNYWNVFGIYFLSTLIAGLGTIACYVGMAFTMPFMGITPTLVYWKITRGAGVSFSGSSPYPRDNAELLQPAVVEREMPRPDTLTTESSPMVQLPEEERGKPGDTDA